jgi:Oxysterol-binding protein/PH domain
MSTMLRGVRAKVSHRRRPSGGLSLEGVAAPALPALPAAPRRHGVLVKYANPLKGWRPRVFTLDTGVLSYAAAHGGDADRARRGRGKGGRKSMKKRRRRADEGEDDVRGIISVQFAAVTRDDGDNTRFAIDTGRDVYQLKAASREERDDWVDAILASKRYFAALVEKAVLRSSRAQTLVADDDESSTATADSSPSSISVVANTPKAAGLPSSPTAAVCAKPTPVTKYPSPRVGPSTQSSECPLLAALSLDTLAPPHALTRDEDDGVAEAAVSRAALVVELRRVVAVVCGGAQVADALIADDAGASPEDALRDLATWTLHVIQSESGMVDARVAAQLRALKSSVRRSDEDDDSDDDDDDSYESDGAYDDTDFYDALSRIETVTPLLESQLMGAVSSVHTNGVANQLNAFGIVPRPLPKQIEQLLPAQPAPPQATLTTVTEVDAGKGAEGVMKKEEAVEQVLPLVSFEEPPASVDGEPRSHLPRLDSPRPKLNIWSIVKDSVGKDLSRISIPVSICEPLSFVQRLAEDIEYSELLDQAAAEPDQHRRMLLVATMIVSHYSSTQGRTGKPFNPLLGETYSLVAPKKGDGIRFLSEQVSHHPPVSACYAESSDAKWKYYNAIEVKNKFWGKSLEVFPTGWNHVEIPEYGDHFEFEQVTACVHNIVIGKLWLDNYGDCEIRNRSTGDKCVVKFEKSGWLSDASSLGTISGVVYDAAGSPKLKMSGRWTDAVYEDVRGSRERKLLWKVEKRPPASASNDYHMTRWAIGLNEPVSPARLPYTAPTDSRLRPDQRALEAGSYDLADRLKCALEDGQRSRRRMHEAADQPHVPRWFTLSKDLQAGRSEYMYNGKYFEAEAAGNFDGVPDLFASASSVVGYQRQRQSSAI